MKVPTVILYGLVLFGQGALEPASVNDRLAQHRGKIVVLNFWASWCKPCRKEMPMLMEVYREFESRGVQLIGACTDDEEDGGDPKGFVEKLSVTYPVWFGLSEAEMLSLNLGDAIPATAIFDRDGTQVFRLIGEMKEKALVERLEWLLGPRDDKPPKELLLPLGVRPGPYKKQ